ncbi:DNA-binding protein [Micromonospora craterilacus]|nr:DNA-binding protein [Micromonospora craterilacus]
MITSALSQDQLLQLPAMVDLTTAARAIGLGRTKAYELARRNAFPCPVLRIGTSYRVRTVDLLELVGIERPLDADGLSDPDGQATRATV